MSFDVRPFPRYKTMPYDYVFDDDKVRKYNRDRAEVFARIGKGWHPVPNIFGILNEDEEAMGGDDDTRRVPASFHKYLHILWRETCRDRGADKADWTAEMYDDQFNMRPSDAGKWKWALAESGLYAVRQIRHVKVPHNYGELRDIGNRGPLSVYRYNTAATGDDWRAFYRALRAACAETPRPFTVASWRAIVRRHVQAQSRGRDCPARR
jgi:hypothetical protein